MAAGAAFSVSVLMVGMCFVFFSDGRRFWGLVPDAETIIANGHRCVNSKKSAQRLRDADTRTPHCARRFREVAELGKPVGGDVLRHPADEQVCPLAVDGAFVEHGVERMAEIGFVDHLGERAFPERPEEFGKRHRIE